MPQRDTIESPNDMESPRVEEVKANELSREKLETVANHVREFRDELELHFPEQEDLITQTLLALISEQCVVITGSDEELKINPATWILRRIVDDTTGEPSCYEPYFSSHGTRPFRYALIDDSLEIPANVHTAVLTASHKLLKRLRSTHGDQIDGVMANFAYSFWRTEIELDPENSKRRFEFSRQRACAPVDKYGGFQVLPFKFSEIDILKKAFLHVMLRAKNEAWIDVAATELFMTYQGELRDIDKMTKLVSKKLNRSTHNAMFQALAAIAVLRYIENPQTPLAIIPEDLKRMDLFLMMRAQSHESIKSADLSKMNPSDKGVLDTCDMQMESFATALEKSTATTTSILDGRYSRYNLDALLADCKAAVENPEENSPDKLIELSNKLAGFLKYSEGIALGTWAVDDGPPITDLGEALYADAVRTYIELLRLHVAAGEVSEALDLFLKYAVDHINKLRHSFYEGEIASAVEAYKQAAHTALMQQASSRPLAPGAALKALYDNKECSETLPASIIAEVRDAFRKAGVDCIADGSSKALLRDGDIVSKCSELEAIYELIKNVQNEGIGGKIPVEKLADVYGQVLNLLFGISTDIKAKLGGSCSFDEACNLMQKLDNALETHSLLNEYLFAVPSRGQLERDFIVRYLRERKRQKMAENPEVQIGCKIMPPNGDANNVCAEWTYVRKKNEKLESKDVQGCYSDFLYAKMLADEVLLQVPWISPIVENIMTDIKQYWGAQWDSNLELFTRIELAENIRKALKKKCDVTFVPPIRRSGRVLEKPLILVYGDLAEAVDEEVMRIWDESQYILDFMTAQGYAHTDFNIKNITNLLLSGDGKSHAVNLEYLETEVDTIDISEIIQKLHNQHDSQWTDLETNIRQALGEVGECAANKLAESRRLDIVEGKDMCADAVNPAALINELNERFSSHKLPEFKHIAVPVRSDDVINTYIVDRIATCLSSIEITPDTALNEALLDPEIDRLAECAASHGFGSESFRALAAPIMRVKITQWANCGVDNIKTAADKAETVISDRNAALQKKSDALTRQIGKALIVFARGDFTALADLGKKYGIDDETVVEFGRSMVSDIVLPAITALEKRLALLTNLEMPESTEAGDFKMQDLATLNIGNCSKVAEIASKLFRVSNKLAADLDKWLKGDATKVYVTDTLLLALEHVINDNNTMYNAFEARQNEVHRGAPGT